MAKNNVMKLVEMITMIELILVGAAAAAVDKNGVDHQQDFTPKCQLLCALKCVGAGILGPVCFATCLLQCCDPPVVSDTIRKCTSTCAQSTCSKYAASGNFFSSFTL